MLNPLNLLSSLLVVMVLMVIGDGDATDAGVGGGCVLVGC